MHLEQNVCEQGVMTGLSRNSLHTSQRKAASSASKAGIDVECQSVESGNSKSVVMAVSCRRVRSCRGFGNLDDGSESRVASAHLAITCFWFS